MTSDGLTICYSLFSGADWADVYIQQKFVCFMFVHLIWRLWFASYARGFHSRFGTGLEHQQSLYWLIRATESSSRIYSPYVFAIGQLIGEIPYSVLCAILYWVLTVCNNIVCGASHWQLFTGVSHRLRERCCWLEWDRIPTFDHHLHGALRSNTRSIDRFNISQRAGEHIIINLSSV